MVDSSAADQLNWQTVEQQIVSMVDSVSQSVDGSREASHSWAVDGSRVANGSSEASALPS